MTLSGSFLQSILENINAPEGIGVGVVGSEARGQASKYSDVDLDIFVRNLPESEYDRSTLRYWDGKLVSLKYVLLEDEFAALTNPRRAIWAAPALSGMQIVLDKNGSLADLQHRAQRFDCSPLQPLANEFASEQVMGCAEEVHKILNGLARGHESAMLYAVWGLAANLLEAVAVQRGILIVSENCYFDLIQDAVGRDTKWVSAFRSAWGLDSTSAQYQTRGAAALMLYRLTAAMFDALIPNRHRAVVSITLRLIKEAGYA